MQSKPWENDSCEHIQSYYTAYPVPVAAALWCGIPHAEVDEHLKVALSVGRAIYKHPYIPCLEPRCRAIHEAIEKGIVLVCRESGDSFDGSQQHVAQERRHVTRQNLKDWISKEFPSDKPSFLFDEVERNTHPAINADSFRTLQVERDALKIRVENAIEKYKALKQEQNRIEVQRASLAAMVEKMNVPSARAETTYLNIIGGLLGLMLGSTPAGKNSVYLNQGAIISGLVGNYGNAPGIGESTLEGKFAEANRSINAN